MCTQILYVLIRIIACFLLPSEDFSKSLNVAIDHLLFVGAFTAGLIHDDQPVLIIATGEKRSHLGGRTVAGPGTVRRISGSVDAEPGRVEADGVNPIWDGG